MLMRPLALVFLITTLAVPCSMSFFKAPYHKNLRSNVPLFRFESNGKAGFIDVNGKVMIPARFDIGWFAEEDFVDGLSPARSGENFGFIDTKGRWVIPPQFWSAQPFSDGLAAVTGQLTGYRFSAFYVDQTGKRVIEFPEGVAEAAPFSEGLAAVRQHGAISVGKVGYVDRTGRVVIPYQFALAGPFRGGLAAVAFDGPCFVAARPGSEAFSSPSEYPASSCGGVPPSLKQRCGEGFIDRQGNVVFRFDGVRDFSEGVAAVERAGKWGFIRLDGAYAIEPSFHAAGSFHDGRAPAALNGKWGYIDPSGKWIIPPTLDRADEFSDGMALTSNGYVDRTGKRVANASEGTAFVQGLAHVALGTGEFGYLDHAGKIVFRYRPKTENARMVPYSER